MMEAWRLRQQPSLTTAQSHSHTTAQSQSLSYTTAQSHDGARSDSVSYLAITRRQPRSRETQLQLTVLPHHTMGRPRGQHSEPDTAQVRSRTQTATPLRVLLLRSSAVCTPDPALYIPRTRLLRVGLARLLGTLRSVQSHRLDITNRYRQPARPRSRHHSETPIYSPVNAAATVASYRSFSYKHDLRYTCPPPS